MKRIADGGPLLTPEPANRSLTESKRTKSKSVLVGDIAIPSPVFLQTGRARKFDISRKSSDQKLNAKTQRESTTVGTGPYVTSESLHTSTTSMAEANMDELEKIYTLE